MAKFLIGQRYNLPSFTLLNHSCSFLQTLQGVRSSWVSKEHKVSVHIHFLFSSVFLMSSPPFPLFFIFFLLFFWTNWPRLHYSRDVSRIGQICLLSSWSGETTGWYVETEDKECDSLSCERSCIPPSLPAALCWELPSITPDGFNSLSCATPSFLRAVLTVCTPIINRETKEFLHICMHTSLLFSIFMFHITLYVPITNSATNKILYSTNFSNCFNVWFCAKPVSITGRSFSRFRHAFHQTYNQSTSHDLHDTSQVLNCYFGTNFVQACRPQRNKVTFILAYFVLQSFYCFFGSHKT
jgi:hypothetical protein